MLTLDAILRTTKHLRSYGSDGRHQFGNEPRAPGVDEEIAPAKTSGDEVLNQFEKD